MYHVLLLLHHGKTYRAPIIGKEHKDSQFSFTHLHYHIDGRFTAGKNAPYDTNENGYTGGVVSAVLDNVITFGIVRLKCRRLTTGLGAVRHKISGYPKWYNSMLGKSCKGKKCPHFGTAMLEENGRLVCPLHHLEGDIATEKIIKAL